MKFIVLITILFMLNPQNANDNLVVICKHGKNIKVEYADSMKGIVSIKTEIKKDTLNLDIQVSTVHKARNYEIALPSNIRFIQYGTVIKDVHMLDTCSDAKVLSGKKALEYLKHNQ